MKRKVSKQYLEKILESDSRTTIYNYILELKAYLGDFSLYLDYDMEIKYDISTHEYILKVNKKK